MKIRQHLTCVIAAQFLLAATAPAFTADACGTFRDQLKRYVRTDPGSGADYGDATFVRAALESYLAQPDLREGGCEALEKKLRAFGTDLSIMPRDLSDFFCTENTDLYDGSPYEGAQYGMILLNAYVGTGCYQM
jgi:hypothetical protein